MMSDRSKKIPELPVTEEAVQGDLFIIEKVSGNTSTTSVIAAEDLFGDIQVNTSITGNTYLSTNNLLITKNSTPVGSDGEFTPRQIWFDSNYIYVSVNGTTVKRVALEQF